MSAKSSLTDKLKVAALSAAILGGPAAVAHAEETVANPNDSAANANGVMMASIAVSEKAKTMEELLQEDVTPFRYPEQPLKEVRLSVQKGLPDLSGTGHNSVTPTQTNYEKIRAFLSGGLEDEPERRERLQQNFQKTFPFINVLVIKGGNEHANKRYENAVRKGMQNVSNSFEDPAMKVRGIYAAYPEESIKRYDGKSTSGSIAVYINDWDVLMFSPKDFTTEELIKNIKRAETYVAGVFERELHTLTKEQHYDFLESLQGERVESVVRGNENDRGHNQETAPQQQQSAMLDQS